MSQWQPEMEPRRYWYGDEAMVRILRAAHTENVYVKMVPVPEGFNVYCGREEKFIGFFPWGEHALSIDLHMKFSEALAEAINEIREHGKKWRADDQT